MPQPLRLGDDWVVQDTRHDRLLVLNDTARRIWELWRQDTSPEHIAARLAEHYAVTAEQVREDVLACIDRWQAAPDPVSPGRDDHYPAQYHLSELPVTPSDGICLDYRVHSRDIRVHLSNPADAAMLAPVLGHLSSPGPGADPIEYHLERHDGQLRLRQSRRVIYQGTSPDMAAVMLLHEMQLAAYRERDNLCVVHAGAVGRGDACVLLPGVAGAGKSTLTAALLHDGWDYLSDDTVPVDAADGRAIALTPPLTVKAGSLAVLSPLYPALPELPEYGRADQEVRYLPPPADKACPADRAVAAVIFPRYRPGGDPRLIEIPAAQAFTRLAEAGIFAHRPRDPARLKALLDWFGGLPSYALEYDRLADACRLVADALAAAVNSVPHKP